MDSLIKTLFPEQYGLLGYDDMHWMDNDGVMVYTTRYIDTFGVPDTPFDYRVIEDRIGDYGHLNFEDECKEAYTGTKVPRELASIHKLTQEGYKPYDKKKRPKHYYCRKNHFRIILTHILGFNGRVPQQVLDMMPDWCKDGTHWEEVRKILKQNNLQMYYNRIFTIIKLKGYLRNIPKITEQTVRNVLKDFDMLNNAWPHYPTHRTYFPILRFIALRLLYENDYDLSPVIPWARTVKKYQELEEEFSNLWDFADNLEIEKMYYDEKKTPKTCKQQCQHCRHEILL